MDTGCPEFANKKNDPMLTQFKKPFLPLLIILGKRVEKRRFTEPPIFIGGCARTGTTVLLSILSAHNDIHCFSKELGLFNKVLKDELGNSIPTRIDRLYTQLLINKIPDSVNRWCEKSPSNIQRLGDIDNYFKGNFLFIQTIRDGRDVILSKHPKDEARYWVSPERWINDVSEGMKYINHPKVLTIKYEELILDFEATAAKICSFLNISLSKEILNWHENTTVTENIALFTRIQLLHKSSISKWKDPKYRERVEELTGNPKGKELLKQCGYD